MGKTTQEQFVVSGIFKLVDGQGIHLVDVLQHLTKNNLVPDWISFIQDSINNNWRLSGTLEKISQACGEVYGPHRRDVVMEKLHNWIETTYKEA